MQEYFDKLVQYEHNSIGTVYRTWIHRDICKNSETHYMATNLLLYN